jgi:hypothetical protein
LHGTHLVNHIHHHDLDGDSTLHVIRVVSNPVRYHSRYRLAREQEEFLKKCPHIKLYTVEAAFGHRHHELVEKVNENHLLVRIKSEIWIKENLINLGVRHLLPRDWKYMAWIDADVIWNDYNWGLEALQQLQHHAVIQPWTDGLDLGNYGNVLNHFRSFGSQHYRQFDNHLNMEMNGKSTHHGFPNNPAASSHPPGDYRRFGHTGFAWACTRAFAEQMMGAGGSAGPLMDWCPLGSADHNMATAMVGCVDFSINKKMPQGFFDKCHEWQDRAVRITHKHIGATHDRLEHFFHGPKKRRYYVERWKILVHFKFDPIKDLMYDDQGIIRLIGKPDLEQAIRHYNRSRMEDSIEEC